VAYFNIKKQVHVWTTSDNPEVRTDIPYDWSLRSNRSIPILKFICPCIASISLKYHQQDATFSISVHFYKLLYMFQAVPPPNIRSTKLYIQRQVLSNQYCCLLQQTAVLVWQYPTLYVQFCAPDDEWRNRLKHVEQFIELNWSRKRCILLVVL
jgi:hypothetical protein